MKDQFFADYLERLEDLQRRLHQAVRDLPMEAMDWSPGPAMNPVMNSVAVLLAHITGVLHEGIDLALDNPPSRVRTQEFQTHGVPSAEMLRRLDAVIDYARGALPRLGLADLAQARQDSARFGVIAKMPLGNTWWGAFRREATDGMLSSHSKISILALIWGVKGQHNIFFGYTSR